MIKSILSISIIAALGVVLFAILLPVQANQVAQQVLGEAVSVNTVSGLSVPVSAISARISGVVNKPSAPSADSIMTDNAPLSAVDIIDATNAQRLKAGLPPLRTNTKLEESAQLKVEDMIKNQYFEHTSPSGKTVADLGTEVGYNYVVLGENLALGDFSSADDLLQAWMNSPGHRANILNQSYEDMGAYAAQGMYQGHMVWFAVQHFGTERTACPSLNASLKANIDALNTSLQTQEQQIEVLRGQIEDPNHADDTAYTAMVNQFNAMVSTYNNDLATSQGEINTYNKEVIAFNKCLSQYQVPASATKE